MTLVFYMFFLTRLHSFDFDQDAFRKLGFTVLTLIGSHSGNQVSQFFSDRGTLQK